MNDAVAQRQKRHFRLRVVAFLVLHGLIALHLILWYGLEIRTIGAIDMQELFRNLIEKNVMTAGALFFLAFVAAGLVWGRIFCGWFCHIGQTYDLLAALWRRLGWRFGWFPLRFGMVFAAFVLVWYYLRESLAQRVADAAFVVDWDATEPWELLPGWVNGSILLIVVLLVMPALLGARAFCRNLCPWGVLLGLTNRFSRVKVRRVGDCTNCGACAPACPMEIPVSRVINTDFAVKSSACTQCLQCVAACPTQALAFTVPAKENRQPRSLPLLPGLTYVPLPVELTFWVLVLIVGLVYDELYGVGIFLAYSLGLILAWATLHIRGLWAKNRLRGVGTLLLVLLAWGVVTKDAMASYHWSAGHNAWEAKDLKAVQHHYEQADGLFWETPTVLMYRLYIIYKATGQEAKRQELYDRYEARRKTQNQTPKQGDHAP